MKKRPLAESALALSGAPSPNWAFDPSRQRECGGLSETEKTLWPSPLAKIPITRFYGQWPEWPTLLAIWPLLLSCYYYHWPLAIKKGYARARAREVEVKL